MTSRTIPTALLITVALAFGALAQTPSMRISGQIERLDGATLMVKTIDGTEVAVTLPDGVLVTALVNRALSDIKQGDFVGSAAVPGGDGKLHAQEVHIFPESLRGMGEGHRPMPGPNRSMTNAVVAEVAVAPEGRDLRLKYHGGEQVIEVTPGARIVGIVRADRSILVPGSAVLVLATKQPDGALKATMVQGEKDGVKPLS
jgi:hypothetical protein